MKVNNRFRSEDAEQVVSLTPSAYWPSVLRGKLEKLLQKRVSRNRRVRSDDTSIVVSVNDRKQRDLKKRSTPSILIGQQWRNSYLHRVNFILKAKN